MVSIFDTGPLCSRLGLNAHWCSCIPDFFFPLFKNPMSQPFLKVWSFPCYSYRAWFWLDIETLKVDRLYLLAICSWQFVPKVQHITAYPLSFLVGSFLRVTAFVSQALTLGVLSLLSDNRQTLSSVDSLNVYTYCWLFWAPDNEAQKYLLIQNTPFSVLLLLLLITILQ